MHPIDIFLLAGVFAFVFMGAKRGFVQELRGLTGLLVSFIFALLFYEKLGLKMWEKAQGVSKTVCFILAFIIIVLVVRLIIEMFIKVYEKSLGQNGQSNVNRLLGAFLGFVQGLFFVGVLTLALSVLPVQDKLKNVREKSLLFDHMTNAALTIVNKIFEIVPKSEKAFHTVLDKIEKSDLPGTTAEVTETGKTLQQQAAEVVEKSEEIPSPSEVAAMYEKEKERMKASNSAKGK
ncbi:hypothetical protein A2V82_13410 [candidate division KSB1 bacterium RBG_16_48_16]|nr:MAG: hypothetical protein A2V82_13410 [candidate division KSB1 bacterium RBG_16_48_16]